MDNGGSTSRGERERNLLVSWKGTFPRRSVGHVRVGRNVVSDLLVGRPRSDVRKSGSGFSVRVVHLSSDRHIIVPQLTALGLVDTDDFGFLGSAELESRDVVDDEEEDVGHDGDVSHDRGRHRELPSELNPVAARRKASGLVSRDTRKRSRGGNVLVDPSTVDLGSTIERGNAGVGEEGGEDRSDVSSDSVKGESIHGVIDTEDDLDSGSVVTGLNSVKICERLHHERVVVRKHTHNGRDETDCEGSGCADETSSGSDTDESSEDTGAKRDGRVAASVDPARANRGGSAWIVRASEKSSAYQSINIQVRPPMAAAKLVTTEAWTDRKFMAPADPPLNPNQPNQRRVVPITTCETE